MQRFAFARRPKGFTLIELLAVVAIAGAMAGLVIISMGNWFGKMKSRAEAAEIHAGLRSSIKLALLKSRPLVIDARPDATLVRTEPASTLPEGWSLQHGRIEITQRGYCKGGELGFSSATSSVVLSVTPGSCLVDHVFNASPI